MSFSEQIKHLYIFIFVAISVLNQTRYMTSNDRIALLLRVHVINWHNAGSLLRR